MMKVGTRLRNNRDWLFSGLAIYLIGLASGSVKQALPLLGIPINVPVWGILLIVLLPLSVATAIFLRKLKNVYSKITKLEADQKEVTSDAAGLSYRDPLTGAWNLRKLEQIYAEEFPRLAKGGEGISGLLIDIDDFDLFQQPPNTFRQGSNLIKQVASVLLRRIGRPDDFVVKYGGDEFLVIAGDTPVSGAHTFATHIQQWLHDEHFYLRGESERVKLCVSIGLTRYNPESDTPESFEDRLYLALQEAKKTPGKKAIVAR